MLKFLMSLDTGLQHPVGRSHGTQSFSGWREFSCVLGLETPTQGTPLMVSTHLKMSHQITLYSHLSRYLRSCTWNLKPVAPYMLHVESTDSVSHVLVPRYCSMDLCAAFTPRFKAVAPGVIVSTILGDLKGPWLNEPSTSKLSIPPSEILGNH